MPFGQTQTLDGTTLQIGGATVIDTNRNIKGRSLTVTDVFVDVINPRHSTLTINGDMNLNSLNIASRITTPDGNIVWGNANTIVRGCDEFQNNIAIGDGAKLCGGSVAVGVGAYAGVCSVCIGSKVYNYVSGSYDGRNTAFVYSSAIGQACTATEASLAVGVNSAAMYNSMAAGLGNYASFYSLAVGNFCKTNGSRRSVVMGSSCQTRGRCDNSVAIGCHAETNYSGSSTTNYGYQSVAIGCYAQTKKQNSVAIGYNSKSLAGDAIAIGYSAVAFSDHCVQLGGNTPATTDGTLFFRQQTICQESWKTGNVGVATIDSAGNFHKTTPTAISAANNATAETAGVPIGGLYIVIGANPAILYVRTAEVV